MRKILRDGSRPPISLEEQGAQAPLQGSQGACIHHRGVRAWGWTRQASETPSNDHRGHSYGAGGDSVNMSCGCGRECAPLHCSGAIKLLTSDVLCRFTLNAMTIRLRIRNAHVLVLVPPQSGTQVWPCGSRDCNARRISHPSHSLDKAQSPESPQPCKGMHTSLQPKAQGMTTRQQDTKQTTIQHRRIIHEYFTVRDTRAFRSSGSVNAA